MSPADLRKLLAQAGLSQRGAARELDMSERQMRRYAAGDMTVPRVVEFALRYLIWQRSA